MFIFKQGAPNERGTYHVEMHDGEPRAYLHCPLCGYSIPVLFPIGADGVVQLPDMPIASAPDQVNPQKPRKRLLRCDSGRCNYADQATLNNWKGNG